MAWLDKRGLNWYVAYRDANRKVKRIRGYRDKLATRQLMAKLEKAEARGEQGLVDPFKVHRAGALAKHLDDYVANLRAVGRDDKYVQNSDKRLRKLATESGWKTLGDVTADGFNRWRSTLPKGEDGRPLRGPKTQNQFLDHLRAFCNWCVEVERLPANPVAKVQKVDGTTDVRRARRALTAEEVAALLKAVLPVHRLCYRFLLSTGLRRQEVADLVWGDVRLNATRPFLKLRAVATKARRADALPLRADLADELRAQRGEAGDTDKVFAAVPTIEEHKAYLTAAGIAYKDDQGRVADFHALRHTFGTSLSAAGVAPREAMELMRHTDMRLTMGVYTDPRLFNLADAVERLALPAVSEEVQAATGTDDRVAPRVARDTSNRQPAATTGAKENGAGAAQTPAERGVSQPSATSGNNRQGEGENSPIVTLFIKILCLLHEGSHGRSNLRI
jgi:integrase